MDKNQIVNLYLQYCRDKGLSDHSLRAYKTDLKDYRQSLATDQLFTKEGLEIWLRHMRLKNLAPTSIKRRIACVKTFFFWLEEQDYITQNPFHKRNFLSITQPKRLPRHLSSEIISKLVRHCAYKKYIHNDVLIYHTLLLALLLLYSTGIRVSELCAITINDIDDCHEKINIKGKGNRERHVFLTNGKIKRLLIDYLELRKNFRPITDSLLINKKGMIIYPNYIREQIHKLTNELGISRRITPHMIRHSTATHLLDTGVDIRHVQKLLGHSSISVTEIYTHVSTTQLQSIIKKADITALL